MRRGESGQGSVENLLVISVIAISVVAASYVFVPTFGSGVESLSSDVSSILTSGTIGGIGTSRGGSGGAGAGGMSGPVIGGPSFDIQAADGADNMDMSSTGDDGNDVTTIGHKVGCTSPLGCTQVPQGAGSISND